MNGLLWLFAMVLHLLFLIPLFYMLREMYLGPPVKAQEDW